MNDDEILCIAWEVGFCGVNECGLSGISKLDERVYVEEYPIGEDVLKFARAIEAATRKECAKIAETMPEDVNDELSDIKQIIAKSIRGMK